MTPDNELLRRYVEDGSEAAFAELVQRHVNLIYSAAVRLMGGDTHLAQDVAQTVFTALARKAPQLLRHPTLGGWLHTATHFAAHKLRRGEHRRQVREQEIFAMQDQTQPEPSAWEQLRPELDDAVNRLKARERDLLLLHYFSDKSHGEIAELLGMNEDTARKRVARTLEKLRNHFSRRGVTVSTALLAAVITANSVQAAPTNLAATLAGGALTGAGSAGWAQTVSPILIMTTKTKLLLGLAVFLTLLALFTVNWRQQTSPTVAANAAPPKASQHSIAAPSSPAAIVASAPSAAEPPAASAANPGAPAAAASPSFGPIRFAIEPAKGRDAVLAALEAYKTTPQAQKDASKSPIIQSELDNLSLLKIAPLLADYSVSLTDLVNDNGLQSARETGFYYTIQHTLDKYAGLPYQTATVQTDDSGTATEATLIASTYDHTVATTLEHLKSLDTVRNGSYEMRLLGISHESGYGGVGVLQGALFWLKSETGGGDLICHYEANPKLPPIQLYTLEDFVAILRPIVSQRQSNPLTPSTP